MLARHAPRVPVIDALHDAPDFGIAPAAHLLAALAPGFPAKSIFLAVVDPGVGGARDAIAIRADGKTFVGPDNGLLSIVWQRSRRRRCFRIAWRPGRLSPSFHGRDLFAPVAARLAMRAVPRGWLAPKREPDILLDAADLARVIYVDHYGNAVTGLRSSSLPKTAVLHARGKSLRYARTFEEAREAFWYRNSMGLVEIAKSGASVQEVLRLRVGTPVSLSQPKKG